MSSQYASDAVYALHLQDYRVGLYLGVLYSAHLTVQGLVTPNAVWNITYNPICDVVEVHRDVMFIGYVLHRSFSEFMTDYSPVYRRG